MTPSLEQIDPDRLYSFAEACRLLPSCRAGKRLHRATLHRWHAAGRLRSAVRRPTRTGDQWFAYGRDLLAAYEVVTTPAAGAPADDFVSFVTKAESDARYREVRKQLDRMGVGV